MPHHPVAPTGGVVTPGREFAAVSARKLLWELTGYGFASAVALGVDTLILRTLVVRAGWHYIPASALAFISGAAIAYLISTKLVFESRRVMNRALEFGYFLSLGVAGLCVNAAALAVGIGVAGWGLVTAKMAAAVCTFATNFFLRRWLLFSPSGRST